MLNPPLKKTIVLKIIIVIGLARGGFSILSLFFQEILHSQQVGITKIGLLVGFTFLFASVGAFLSGKISSKMSERNMVLFFTSILLITFLIFLANSFVAVFYIILFVILLILGEIIDTSLNVIFNHNIDNSTRNTILSIANAFVAFFMALSSLLIGLLSEYYETIQILLSYGVFICLTVLLVFYSINKNELKL